MSLSGNRWSRIKSIERKIRTNLIYSQWVERNKSWGCNNCNGHDDLELHHITELYHIIMGTIKSFSTKDAIEYILSRHASDEIDSLTLCNNCHGKIHPNLKNVHGHLNLNEVVNFVVFPRKFEFKFQQGKKNQDNTKVNLVCFQILLGFGYYILNDGLKGNILILDSRDFARKLDKTPGTSFNNSLISSLNILKNQNIVKSFDLNGRKLEVFITNDYLAKIDENPWFLSLQEIYTSKMSILTLKWFLSFQNRKNYKISKDKICSHLCLTTTTPAYVKKTILEASKHIRWVKSNYEKGIFKFEISKNKGIPVYKLRTVLNHRLLYRD